MDMYGIKNSEERSAYDIFLEQLEIAILASRGGGSGARAVTDTLLSLYNGHTYKANLSDWYLLDIPNRRALLYVLSYQTTFNSKAIDQYLPQYIADWQRMMDEKGE